MIKSNALLRLTVAAIAALALGGCISLFPKSDPAQLYRFGQTPVSTTATAPPAGSVAVFRAGSVFQSEASGDRLLAITGDEASYIADSRWVAPASVLWDQAVLTAFDAAPGRVRLVSRGELARADYVLRLDVRSFETRYENGPDAAPTVLVRVRAALTRPRDRAFAREQIFEARVPAAGNRVSAIVGGYDRATADVLGQLARWLEAEATPLA
ncbi:ABC-type transport auxiliary lipoprotein family protein [Phenylobacterium sp.]|uniref:ABC-type transport auxiliary lipoprotein family protein n=1 Tax=Phenylobacterium sp. TaxID=1871053 RepID=UPI0035B44303